ncbi:MAG: UDP-N-acetylmuramate dehydrogenase [Firmicutes bacterium]|nr:UDP-N-acetylmuramate dehydrogenase [Bacillota bacterium]
MSRHTSFKIGGPADLVAIPSSVDDLRTVLAFCTSESLPWFVMGNGTNLLVRDKGIRGVVIKLAGTLDRLEIAGETLTAGSGALLRKTSEAAAARGLAGLEFTHGIPGTVGGAAVMNAGAYDGEMKDVIESVELLSPGDGRVVVLEAAALGFAYRKSVLQDRSDIVLSATMRLKRGDRPAILERMSDLDRRRREKQPLDLPSAGSVFRRPEGAYAGPLIEGAGLKGHRIGGAEVSTVHAGFIVNRGGATADDVLEMITFIRDAVLRKYGVELTPEIKVVGEA